ncbi:CCA tRNA nucleotidyltransferase [Zavarzinia marina]|uniref:CCA tRNA nucleotidyltransferase n=1 Tax=Zavarzinia marina TaxID=2911065 RepID=UPI0022A86FFE|nr:CCA tRNA nucleotidyltransferase [Zavarzinia marina]
MIPDRLPPGGWRDAEAVRAVVAALTAGGTPVRFVGGCVRDALLGEAPADIDIATPDPPKAVMALARAAGLKALPTGIAHGTVTVVADHQPVEVTTLRHDVETDGRHAVVAFTDDWHADAQRRDFTINALYADPDGTLFDPVGGLADLDAGVVRFIGDAGQRLAEDYLRALRFFRFHARFAKGAADEEALSAIAAAREDLRRLSAERIASELLKTLILPRAALAVDLMEASGVLAVILPEAADTARMRRLAGLGLGDGLLRLAALLPDEPALGPVIGTRLRLSRAMTARLAAALEPAPVPAADEGLRALIHRAGRQAAVDRLTLAGEGARAAHAAAIEVPAFPLKGADAAALGLARGPEMGARLRAVEDWWLAEGLRPDRAACLSRLREDLGR